MLIICGFVILSLKPPFDLIYNFYLNKEFFKEVLADFFFFFNKLNVSLWQTSSSSSSFSTVLISVLLLGSKCKMLLGVVECQLPVILLPSVQ